MRAITYDRFGPSSDVLVLADLPTPDPASGEVLVRLHTSGVNPSDVKARAGGRPGVTKPPFPTIIPHSDGAGVIEAVGDGVDAARVGQRVWVWNGQWQRAFGTAAEYIALPAAQAMPLADTVSFEHGATLGIPAMTAAHVVLGNGPVAGKTLLISGGAGTVGHLAVQIAVQSGARVIATARGPGMEAARAAGADTVLDYTASDLAEQILAANNGAPVEQIVEVEFGTNLAVNTAVIAENGRIVAYGSAQEMTPMLPFYPLMFKAVTLELALIYLLTPTQRAQAIGHVNTLLEAGTLTPRVAEVLPLEACAQAHEAVAAGKRAGSVLLRM